MIKAYESRAPPTGWVDLAPRGLLTNGHPWIAARGAAIRKTLLPSEETLP
jgi:hypothetical protein